MASVDHSKYDAAVRSPNLNQPCVLLYRYSQTMRWAVAGKYPNEATAIAAKKRFARLMAPETEFTIGAA